MTSDSTGKRTTQDYFAVLGLDESATWHDVKRAYRGLVSDLTPGPNASHANVAVAQQMLDEVNEAFASLRGLQVA